MNSRHVKHIGSVAVLAFLVAAGGIALNAQTYTTLYTYPGTDRNNSGVLPPQVMSQGRDGLLYSTIVSDGTQTYGTAYTLTTAGQRNTIYNFCAQTKCADGGYPEGGLNLGFDGNLYGTTEAGGTDGAGTVFRLTPAGVLTTIWNFVNGTDESVPSYAPFQAQNGNLYGVSYGQYNGQYGAFYRVSSSGVFTALSDFNYTDGALANSPTQGTDGNFYGTTELGGANRIGVVYKITPSGNISVLHNFAGYPSDGSEPEGILVQGNNGDFYGVTYQGGTANQGTIFKITAAGAYTLLYSFNDVGGTDGVHPLAGLTLGTDGNFYGATAAGGTKNDGTLYQITAAGVRTILYNFCDPTCNGFNPETALVQHTNGKFYGNTTGNSLGGSLFYQLDMGLKPFAGLVTWSAKVGKTVEIIGQGFTGTTKVSFNGTSATFAVVSDTYMTANIPAGATTGTVTVSTPKASLKSNRKFLVTPQVLSFSPPSGPVGTVVTITGNSLTQTEGVGFGDYVPSTFTVNSDTQVTATVPPGAKTGPVGALTPGGTAISTAVFTVTP